ncbi:hypothetical protein EVAR_71778_1, partial [Eumeta japonica]
LANLSYLLVTLPALLGLYSDTSGGNTNTGPIIPPTPRTTIKPLPPYRDPAPVWEDITNDILTQSLRYPSFKPSDNTTVAQTELLSGKQFGELESPDMGITQNWSSWLDSSNTTLSSKETYGPTKSYTQVCVCQEQQSKSKEILKSLTKNR